jgi:hypothetical protein
MSRPGSRAAKGRSIDEIQPLPPPRPITDDWTVYRHLDPIRAAALQAAAQVYPHPAADTDDTAMILVIARQFEQYLAGEEADGQT